MKLRFATTRLLTTCVATVALAACSLVIDPDELVSSATAPGEPDGSVEGGVVQPDGSGGDAPIIDPSCKPSGPEICGDGLDNDCNGFTDCADATCTEGFACVEGPPDGWTPIALAETTRPACPEGFAQSTDVSVVQGDGTHTCKCTCGGGCATGIVLTKGTDLSCGAGTSSFLGNATTCTTIANFDVPSFARVGGTTGGSCSQTNTPTKSNLTNGRTCAPAQVGGGCGGTLVCLPKAAGFSSCVAKAGPSTCPAGFTKQRRVGTASTTDSRTCTGCSCTARTCSYELKFWTQPQCAGTADSTITNSSCAASSPVANAKGYTSKTTTGGCAQATASTPQGQITFENEQTICCK